MTRNRIDYRAAVGGPLLLALVIAGCQGATGGSTPRPTAATSSATPTASAPAEPSPTPTASDGIRGTPALALPPSDATPLRPAPALTDWVVGRRLTAAGRGFEFFADDALWAVNRKDAGFTGNLPNGEIYRIDPATGAITATVEHARGGFPAIGEGAAWLINAEFGQTVTRVDLGTLEVDRFRSSTTDDPVPEAIAVAGGKVWVGNNHDGTVAVVDPATLTVTETIRLTEPGSYGVRGKAATDGRSVWFGISRTGEIVRLDAASGNELSRIRLPQVPHEQLPEGMLQSESSLPEQLVVVGNRLYASTVDHVYAIDVSVPRMERIVADLASDVWTATVLTPGEDDDVWALLNGPAELVRIDAATSKVLGTLPLGIDGDAVDVVAGAGSVWVRVPDGVVEIRPR